MTLTQDNIDSFIQYLADNHIVTLKNDKFRVISIWKSSSRVSDEAKDKVSEFVSGYRTEKEAWFCLGHHILDIPRCPICGNLAKFAEKKYNVCCESHSVNSLQWKKDKVTDAFKSKTREDIDNIRSKTLEQLSKRNMAMSTMDCMAAILGNRTCLQNMVMSTIQIGKKQERLVLSDTV